MVRALCSTTKSLATINMVMMMILSEKDDTEGEEKLNPPERDGKIKGTQS